MTKIKAALAEASAWLDQSIDNRACAGLLAFALGFWINLARMMWFP